MHSVKKNLIHCFNGDVRNERRSLSLMFVWLAVVLLAILFGGATHSSAAPAVSASLEPQGFSLDQVAELIITMTAKDSWNDPTLRPY